MDRLRTVANQRELDPSFSVPCRRCAGLLQEWNRFCPFCLEDQFQPADEDADIGARSAIKSARYISASNEDNDSAGLEFVDTQHPAAAEVVPASDLAGRAPNLTRDTEISLPQPSDYWQTEVLGVGGKASRSAGLPLKRLTAGIAVAVVLTAAAFFGSQQKYFDTRTPFKVDTDRVQTALNRGDLNSATQLLDAIEAKHPDDPGVQSLRDALDLRIRERSTSHDEPFDTVAGVTSATPATYATPATFDATSASASDDAVPTSSRLPEQSPVGASVQAAGQIQTQQKDCSVTLAALALCPKE